MNRRDFFALTGKGAFGVMGASMLGQMGWLTAAGGGAADVNVVSGEVTAATRKAVEIMGGMSRFVSPGDKVVVKANLGFAGGPESGTTTSPTMVRTIIEMALAAGASEVVLVENPVMPIESCWRRSGAAQTLTGLDKFRFVRLTDDSLFKQIKVHRGKSLTEVGLSTDILESNVLINLPQAKSHSGSGVSLGLKNLMGVVQDRGYYHGNDLEQCIADAATVIPCHLIICDATRALLTGGPGGPGKVSTPGWVAAGTDIVAVDSYVVGQIPFYNRTTTGPQIRHIAAAYDLNVGQMHPDKISVNVNSV
jgi:uncharacterized protein (DUF362 family)